MPIRPGYRADYPRDIQALFRNVSSFLHHRDLEIDVPQLGQVKVDVAFGGNYFAYLDSQALGIPVDIKHSKKLKYFGALLKDAVNQKVSTIHPTKPYINKVDIVTFHS